MTAGLIRVMPSEIVVVADTLCKDQTGAKVDRAKLFIHGGKAAIFSWGRGPLDVQQRIEALDPCEVRPEALAQAILSSFAVVSPDHFFGLYVAGFDGSKLSLWHVDRHVPQHGVPVQDRTSVGGVVYPDGGYDKLSRWLDSNERTDEYKNDPVKLGTHFVREAYVLAPETVSAEAKAVRVTAAGAAWV